MEDDAADELPLLEEVDAPALDERVIADEESRRDSRDTPLRQTPVIQSIHCGCYLGQMINVKQVARKLWNAVFDPKRSQHGVLVALRHPRVSVCVFPSGKVISMGAKSEASALIACRKVARMIQRLPGYNTVRLADFKVHNVTASGALGYRLDLRALARHPLHEEYVEYNPDQFPGLHYKLLDARPAASHVVAATSSSTSTPAPTAASTSTGTQLFAVKAEPPSSSLPSSMPHPSSPAIDLSAAAAAVTAATSGPSSLTLTLYFSGRFTLVGAQHELDVYRHFEHISRALFPFSHIQTKQAQQGLDTKPLPYELWLEDSLREERSKGGRMGWEEEADRVTREMDKREKRRTRSVTTTHNNSHSTIATDPASRQRQQQAGVGGEVRVKAEPGTVIASAGPVRDEIKEAGGPPDVRAATSVELGAGRQSSEVHVRMSDAEVVGQQKVDERKEDETAAAGDGLSGDMDATITTTMVVAAHEGEDEKSGEVGDDVEWE